MLYSGEQIRAQRSSNEFLTALKTEWAKVLRSSSGVLVIQKAFADLTVITRMNLVFAAIFAQEIHKASGDHFAKAGANGHIWNVLQKSALQNPQAFIDYYQFTLAISGVKWLEAS